MTSFTARAISMDRGARPVAARPRSESAAALAAAALLAAMAAMPDADKTAGNARAVNGVTGVAQDGTSGRPGRENTFGAFLGAPYHYPSDFRLQKTGGDDITLHKVEWFTNPFTNPLYYGARLQHWYDNGTAGTMIDFVHSKAFAPMDQQAKISGTVDGKPLPETGRVGDFFQKLEFSHGHNMLTLNGLLRFANFSNLLVPYVGVGAGVSLPHSEMQRKGETQRTYEYQYTGPTAQALIGLELRLRTGSVFLEYKFTIADYRAPHTYTRWQPVPNRHVASVFTLVGR